MSSRGGKKRREEEREGGKEGDMKRKRERMMDTMARIRWSGYYEVPSLSSGGWNESSFNGKYHFGSNFIPPLQQEEILLHSYTQPLVRPPSTHTQKDKGQT